MKKSSNNLFINLITQLLVFFINLFISFFLTPFFINSVGIEAYGFMALSTQFINVLNLIIIALNSMAGRFITIAIHQNDFLKANKYFTSVITSNWIYVLIIFIPSAFFIYYLEFFVSIPVNLIFDIKILHSILFINYFIGLVFSTYSISTFVVNKIYLSSLRSLESNIIRIFFIFLLYYFFPPFAFYLILASFIANIYTILFNIYYKKKYLPHLNFSKKNFDLMLVFEVFKSGLWNVFTRIGQLLLDGFDLFISNWFLGSSLMGLIALSKTIPSTIVSLIGFLVYSFYPNLTYLYSQGKVDVFKNELKKSFKIMALILNIPLALLFVFGKEFYFLWLGNTQSETIYLLSSVSLIPLILSGSLNGLNSIFTITNKLKLFSLSYIAFGLIGFVLSVILLTFTKLGIFSIVIASSLVGVLRILIITIPFGAKYLGLEWHTFYGDMFSSFISLIVAMIIGLGIKFFIYPNDWFTLLFNFGLTFILSFLIIFNFILSKSDRKNFFKLFLKK
jgi:O-antigen/teichoic acid export membrane protein